MSCTNSSIAEIIEEAESGIKGGNQFLDFIRFDIDIKNIKTLFRLRADSSRKTHGICISPGAFFQSADFASLNTIQDQGEFIDQLKIKIRNNPCSHSLMS